LHKVWGWKKTETGSNHWCGLCRKDCFCLANQLRTTQARLPCGCPTGCHNYPIRAVYW